MCFTLLFRSRDGIVLVFSSLAWSSLISERNRSKLANLSPSVSTVVLNESDLRLGFPGGAAGEDPPCRCRRLEGCRFDPWARKMPWRRSGSPLQYSCLDSAMDGGAWRAVAPRVAESDVTEAT